MDCQYHHLVAEIYKTVLEGKQILLSKMLKSYGQNKFFTSEQIFYLCDSGTTKNTYESWITSL